MRLLTWGALLSFAAISALPTTVRAEDWCGFHAKTGSLVRCGYSSFDECKLKLAGQKPICIPNPEFARRQRSQRPRLALANF